MLEFRKDGKKVECMAIYNRGRVGQVVILDHVSFGDNSDFAKFPLARYSQPHAFTIMECVEVSEMDVYYILLDGKGNRVLLRDKDQGTSGAYLYDANEWLTWQKEYKREQLAQNDREIERLNGHLALLKEILIKQGIHLISQETAKKLGIV